jgi:hypothetical protein
LCILFGGARTLRYGSRDRRSEQVETRLRSIPRLEARYAAAQELVGFFSVQITVAMTRSNARKMVAVEKMKSLSSC